MEYLELVEGYWQQGQQIALEWITSPAAYAQFGLLIGAYLVARIAAGILRPKLSRLLTPAATDQSYFATGRRFVLMFLPLLLPLLAYILIGIGEQITRSLFGSGAVIAFGKRVFIFLAVRLLVRDIITDPFLKLIGRYAAIPIALLYVFGLLDPVTTNLEATRVELGDISFSVMTLVRGVLAGSILFWLGQWSASTGTTYIRAQDGMRPPTRELAAKATEAVIYAVVFFLLLNVLGLDLSAFAILGGAIGVGLGFGLQKIASNFISGVILLLEGQMTVGDYVTLDGGESGTIIKLGARATILETFDGKWIVVPNEDFITSRVVNWSDAGSGNRYEVDFTVSYECDINTIPEIVASAVEKHPKVLSDPERPDVELSGFGDSGVEFTLEFWIEGIDDGRNKMASEVRFLVWNALRDAGIEIPFPQREIRYRDKRAEA